MLDLAFIGITLSFFLACFALIVLFESLSRED